MILNLVKSSALDLSVRNLSFVLFAIYCPCSGNVDQFSDRVTSILSSNRIKRREVVVAGDINIILLNAEDNNVINFLGSMRSLFLIPTIRHPTRFSPTDVTVATCLDHISINHSQWIPRQYYIIVLPIIVPHLFILTVL